MPLSKKAKALEKQVLKHCLLETVHQKYRQVTRKICQFKEQAKSESDYGTNSSDKKYWLM